MLLVCVVSPCLASCFMERGDRRGDLLCVHWGSCVVLLLPVCKAYVPLFKLHYVGKVGCSTACVLLHMLDLISE